jgi:hypothetical protein
MNQFETRRMHGVLTNAGRLRDSAHHYLRKELLMKKAAQISGYLSKGVADKNQKLAKETRRHFYKVVKDAQGSMTKFDVTNGQIFIELKDEKGLKELQSALSTLPNVTVEEVSPIKLVFLKSQAQAEAKAA